MWVTVIVVLVLAAAVAVVVAAGASYFPIFSYILPDIDVIIAYQS
jgi:hypothetical protein